MSEKQVLGEPSGVLLVNKHAGVTSHDIVGQIRRLYGTRRVGHTGTLDPMATGVLVILIGRAAKACEYLASDVKRYRAGLRLGLTSDTEDTTGEVLTRSEAIPSQEDFYAILPQFLGKIQQIPPMYSALKVGGQKLCDLARRGVTVDRQAREIEIFALDATPTDSDCDYLLDVRCSGGTYIRTLCADIGAALGCGGAMSSLRRAGSGHFTLDAAYTIEALEAMTPEAREALLLPTESLFSELAEVRLPTFYERLADNGQPISLKKLYRGRFDAARFPVGARVRIAGENKGFFALGEICEDAGDLRVRPVKKFVL